MCRERPSAAPRVLGAHHLEVLVGRALGDCAARQAPYRCLRHRRSPSAPLADAQAFRVAACSEHPPSAWPSRPESGKSQLLPTLMRWAPVTGCGVWLAIDIVISSNACSDTSERAVRSCRDTKHSVPDHPRLRGRGNVNLLRQYPPQLRPRSRAARALECKCIRRKNRRGDVERRRIVVTCRVWILPRAVPPSGETSLPDSVLLNFCLATRRNPPAACSSVGRVCRVVC